MSRERIATISYRLSMWGRYVAFQILVQRNDRIRTGVVHTADSDLSRKYCVNISANPELAKDVGHVTIYLRGSKKIDDFRVTRMIGDSLDREYIRLAIFESVKSLCPFAEECVEDDGTTITVYT